MACLLISSLQLTNLPPLPPHLKSLPATPDSPRGHPLHPYLTAWQDASSAHLQVTTYCEHLPSPPSLLLLLLMLLLPYSSLAPNTALPPPPPPPTHPPRQERGMSPAASTKHKATTPSLPACLAGTVQPAPVPSHHTKDRRSHAFALARHLKQNTGTHASRRALQQSYPNKAQRQDHRILCGLPSQRRRWRERQQ